MLSKSVKTWRVSLGVSLQFVTSLADWFFDSGDVVSKISSVFLASTCGELWKNDILGHIIWVTATLVHDCIEGTFYQVSEQTEGAAHTLCTPPPPPFQQWLN